MASLRHESSASSLSPSASTARGERLALCVWVLILAAVCLRVLCAAKAGSVYPIFAAAARHWLAGADLYRTSEGEPYRYSPLVTVALVPFSLLPDRLGGVVWRLLNAAVYLGAFAWWARTVLPWPVTRTQLAGLFLLIVPLSVGSVNNGQSNPLVLGLLLAGVAAVAGGRWNLASACVAGACLFKLYPVAVGLLLAAVYPRRFAGRFAVALALGLALPFLLQRPDYVAEQYASWLEYLRGDDRTVLPPELWYRDLRLLGRMCGLTVSTGTYLLIQLGSAAALALLCLAGRLAAWTRRQLLTWLLGLGCCWMTLVGPATESCTYILLAPTLAAALCAAWQERQPGWLRSLLLVSFVLFAATQAAAWFPEGARRFHVLGPHPLAGLLLLVGLLAGEWWRSVGHGQGDAAQGPVLRPARAA